MSGDKICMKNNIRKTYKTKRAQMSQEDVRSKSRIAAKKFLLSDIYKTCKTLMLYMPLGNEIDTSEIISFLLKSGKKVAVPYCYGKNMDFYYNDIMYAYVWGPWSPALLRMFL